MQAAGRECVAEQLRPPPIIAHKNTTPPRPRPVSLDGAVIIKKHLETFVLVDACFFFNLRR